MIIFLKVTIEYILQYLSWKEYVETFLFSHAVCQDNKLHWAQVNMSTRSEWITVLAYDESLPINNITQMKLLYKPLC